MRKIILLMIILLSALSCAKEDEEIKKIFKIPENKKILEKQIHSGSRGEDGSFKRYTKEDLEDLLEKLSPNHDRPVRYGCPWLLRTIKPLL